MKKIITLLAGLSFICTSCELDLDPEGQISNEQLRELAAKNPDLVLGPMLAGATMYMYNGTRGATHDSYGFMIWNHALDCMGNDMVLLNTSNWFGSDYLMDDYRTDNAVRVRDNWYNYYKIIYRSNQILDLIPEDATGDALMYKAQALTFRSLAFYYLVNLYQDSYKHGGAGKAGVPLTLTVNGALPRAPLEEVYTQVIADLREAVSLFSAQSYNAKSSSTDIDQTVANVILARMLLTHGDYADAASAAQSVIAQYSLMNEEAYLNQGFLKVDNSETIWGYKFDQESSIQNRSFASHMSPVSTGYGQTYHYAMDDRLYNRISESDYRKKNFLAEPKTVEAPDGVEVNMVKYTAVKFAVSVFNTDAVYFRLSEMYLLNAEALARGGNNTGAQDALYALVSQRDPEYVKSTKTGDALLEEIFFHSRVELWGEGHEFFTNKRFNVGVNRNGSTLHLNSGLVIPAGKDFTFQIPLSLEIERNPYITQEDQNPL